MPAWSMEDPSKGFGINFVSLRSSRNTAADGRDDLLAIKGSAMPKNFFHLISPVRRSVRTRQRMQGGKLKAVRMVVSSSPNLTNALHKQNHRCPRENSKGGGDGEERAVGCAADIKVHGRVAEEVVGLSPGEEKSWWIPHPESGVFTPRPDSKALSSLGPRLPFAAVDEDKKVWVRAEENLEDPHPSPDI